MSRGWAKAFIRRNWMNRPPTSTPINATNLNAEGYWIRYSR